MSFLNFGVEYFVKANVVTAVRFDVVGSQEFLAHFEKRQLKVLRN